MTIPHDGIIILSQGDRLIPISPIANPPQPNRGVQYYPKNPSPGDWSCTLRRSASQQNRKPGLAAIFNQHHLNDLVDQTLLQVERAGQTAEEILFFLADFPIC